MGRILKEAGFTANDILAKDDFRFFYDKEKLIFNDEKMKTVIEKAEEYLEKEFSPITLSLYRDYIKNGDRGRFQSKYFPRRTAVMTLAVAEMYKREGRYVEKLADVLWMILEESSWVISAHHAVFAESRDNVPNVFGTTNNMHNLDLFSAATAAVLGMVYTYCKKELDAISPTICKRLKYEVNERIFKPYLNRYYDWMGIWNPMRSNWCPWITSNVMTAAAVLCDDEGERRRIIQRAMNSLDTYTESNNPDGGCDEGPNYWGASVATYYDALCILYDLSGGKINVFSHPFIKSLGEYIVNMNIHEKNYVNFADARPRLDHDGVLIKEFGDRCGSAAMSAFGAYIDPLVGTLINDPHAYRVMRHLTSPKLAAADSMARSKSVFYDYIKVMALRENENTDCGFFLAMKGGNNNENHNHNDVGCFIVSYEGKDVIIDPGVGRYMNQAFRNRENSWHRDSDFHNLPIIGGNIQKRGADAKSENEVFDGKSLSIELSSAYTEEAGLISFVRKCELGKDCVTVTDSIKLKAPTEVDFVFMVPSKPEICEDGILLNAGRRLTYDKLFTASVEELETASAGVAKRTELPVIYRIHLKTTLQSDTVTFTVK